MKILIGCECSGVVREAFRAVGWDAWSCDIVPTDQPGQHIVNDVRNGLDAGWDAAIFHPPCTHLARSGQRHWEKRQFEQREAIRLVDLLWNAPIPMIAIENPLGVLSYKLPFGSYPESATGYVWRHYDDLIHPWMFGDPEQKATCLWLKGLPPLMRTLTTVDRNQTGWKLGPSETRAKERAQTFPGFAAAMAAQWGTLR